MGTQQRIIELFIRLLNKENIIPEDIVNTYGVSLRTAQRDFKAVKNAIRQVFDDQAKLVKDDNSKYHLESVYGIDEKYILSILKMILATRSLNTKEMRELTQQMLEGLPEKSQKFIRSEIQNELTFMAPIQGDLNRSEILWEIEQFIDQKQMISIKYRNFEINEHPVDEYLTVYPISTFFDNHYFYVVVTESNNTEFKTLRIDWILQVKPAKAKVSLDYSKKYEVGLKRPYVLFGYQGEKIKIRFEYEGYIGYVKDQFPSCKVISTGSDLNKYSFKTSLLEIEVEYSTGVKLWLLSQLCILTVVSPKFVVEDIKSSMQEALRKY